MKDKQTRDRQIAEVLRRATEGLDEDASHLVRSVPTMMAEARRRAEARAAAQVDPLAAMDAAARAWAPRLALATLAPVIFAVFLLVTGSGGSDSVATGGDDTLDRLFLTGGYSEEAGDGQQSDPVYEALFGETQDHG
ncbi:hypothetical protein ABI59_15695 [Acidobacteria bacterium Mor1]|nr:hypothetical protein ABI59_15695 [Acidobacteria bacterium Mor1]